MVGRPGDIAPEADDANRAPAALAPALAAMTGLQAVVAAALFAPGVIAPAAGLDAGRLALWSTTVFAVGTATALFGGRLVRTRGAAATAVFCALAVAIGAAILAGSTGLVALLVAAVAIGLAFGPETPASTTLLAALTPPARRPLVLSVRQTGNQIGAAGASLTLPLVAATLGVAAAFGLVAAAALVLAGCLLVLSRGWRAGAAIGRPLALRAVVRLLRENRDLGRLALVSVPWGALQLLVNGWFVLLMVETRGLDPIDAGRLLAVAQIGGLVGRLGWGAVATATGTRPLLIGLGLVMGLTAAGTATAGAALPPMVHWVAAAVLGLTASGWNGLFVAEVARLAPEGRVAETTGAVLSVSYLGLVVGPLVVAAVTAIGGLAGAFVVIGAAAALAAVFLARGRP
jgi:MFS family permease